MIIRTIALLSLLFGAAGLSFGQETAVPEKGVFFFNQSVTMHGISDEGIPNEVFEKAKTALNLSDVQVTAVKALLKMRSQSTEQIMQEAEQAHQRVENLMSQNNPNPADVGAAHLAAQAAHQRLMEQDEKFRTDFKALLNADQRALLARLDAASQQIEPLQMLGVLGGVPDSFHLALPAFGATVRYAK